MSAKPKSIFEYHDYREILGDWMKKRSLRQIGKILGVSPSFLSLVLRNKRNFSHELTDRWANEMGLKPDERTFLHKLVNLAGSPDLQYKKDAYRKLKKCKPYETVNQEDHRIHEYLSNWYFVAIREMATLPGFKLDAKWIQSRLLYRVSIANIHKALRFLIKNGFIKQGEQKEIKARGAVFRLAQAEFHEQMAKLGLQSFFETEKEMRKLLGKTITLTEDQFKAANALIEQTLQAIQTMADAPKNELNQRIFHFLVMQFPLSEEISQNENQPINV
jgi:uncharacterized protein (TIGR02147 family)